MIPPAPVLSVKISAPREPAPTEPLPALLDTGADYTLVPLSWLLRVDAPEARWAFLRGLWSEQRQVTLYLVDLHLDIGTLAGVEVVGVEDEELDQEIVLGRNILNQVILLLDGPHQQTDVLDRRPVRF
jgi:hypothetical protein